MSAFNDASSPIHSIPSHQISIVDVFFPGFTSIFTATQQLLSGDLDSYARLLCIYGLLVFLGRYAYKYLGEFVETFFTSTIHIPSSNEAHDMFINWASSQPFAQEARSSLVSFGTRRRMCPDSRSDASKPLYYSPWNGSFFFWYKNHILMLRSRQIEVRFHQEEKVSISCIGRSPKILRELLSECRTEYLKLLQNKTSIFKHPDGHWKITRPKDIRRLSTVIMNEEEKTELLRDIGDFLAERTRGWYSARGIPYRRGFLLYGPPGTGKSSLCSSIAGCFNLDIYILSLANVDDSGLGKLFSSLPQRCVVLLEDIDAAGTAQSRDAETEDCSQVAAGSAKIEPQRKLSLSSLLNAIDGVSSDDGRLLIMTTNHIERLDGALIRPGRIDKKIEFQLADEDMIARIFCIIFKQTEDDTPDQEKRVRDNERVEQLAKDFAARVPGQEFSAADILSFLLNYRHSSAAAVDNVEAWVRTAKEERRKPKSGDVVAKMKKASAVGERFVSPS